MILVTYSRGIRQRYDNGVHYMFRLYKIMFIYSANDQFVGMADKSLVHFIRGLLRTRVMLCR